MHAQFCLTLCNPMDCSHWAPLSMEFSRQEYCSVLPYPPPGDLPHPGIKPLSLASLALAVGFFTIELPVVGFPGGTSGKEPTCQGRRCDTGSIPGLGRSPGGGHDNPFQYSCLENPQGQRILMGCSL